MDNIDFQLMALSTVDGRNRAACKELSKYFSEFALFKYRIVVEVSYLIFLSKQTGVVRKFTAKEEKFLKSIYEKFPLEDAKEIKKKEKTTKHDMKAVEYFIAEKLKRNSLSDVVPFIHFALTSYDTNSCAYALMILKAREEALLPKIRIFLVKLNQLIRITKEVAMLGRTHGQPAVPTTLGKELAVFFRRVSGEFEILRRLPIEGKLTGAVGNFNAHAYVFSNMDWIKFSSRFVSSLGLEPNLVTTQIVPYDSWIRVFDSMRRINSILVNFVQDMWLYISMEYFNQRNKSGEVGSSTMSQKINPIYFENAEGNLQLSNSLLEFFSRKLAVSRLQRDLSDSTVKRNIGLAFAYVILSLSNILEGLARVTPNINKMRSDLEMHWEVFAEGVQTFLRSKGNTKAYELLKEKTRGKTFTKEEFHKLIDALPVDEKDKRKLKINSLAEYTGLAKKIVEIGIS